VSAHEEENGLFTANANFTIYSDFQSGVAQLSLGTGDSKSTSPKTDIKTNINLCKVSEKYSGNFLAKLFLENVANHINFEIKCPFKKVSGVT
jgi:hypothetical protein